MLPRKKFQNLKSYENERSNYEDLGYVVVRGQFDEKTINTAFSQLKRNIIKCSEDLNLDETTYLEAVSRWVNPSPVMVGILSPFEQTIRTILESILEGSVYLKKSNIICKTPSNFSAIPLHQDLPYSPQNPYQISVWVALNDIDENSGPLKVCPKSHKDPLCPAVDFWSPSFQESKKKTVNLPLCKGDLILFSSKIWHGSSPSLTCKDRYALVTRWSREDYVPDEIIPPIEPDFFGMWNCGDITREILSQSYQYFFHEEIKDFDILIDRWLEKLDQVSCCGITFQKCQHLLRKLKILNLAHTHHHGGDASGKIYKDLWFAFLEPLNEHLESSSNENS